MTGPGSSHCALVDDLHALQALSLVSAFKGKVFSDRGMLIISDILLKSESEMLSDKRNVSFFLYFFSSRGMFLKVVSYADSSHLICLHDV